MEWLVYLTHVIIFLEGYPSTWEYLDEDIEKMH